jgi:hypothetical protein
MNFVKHIESFPILYKPMSKSATVGAANGAANGAGAATAAAVDGGSTVIENTIKKAEVNADIQIWYSSIYYDTSYNTAFYCIEYGPLSTSNERKERKERKEIKEIKEIKERNKKIKQPKIKERKIKIKEFKEGKNKGKINETTALEQCILECRRLWNMKKTKNNYYELSTLFVC